MRAAVDRDEEKPGDSVGYLLALALISVLAVVVRVAAAWILKQPLVSDPVAYFTMAKGLAEHGVLADNFGQHAFYSAGYPLVLAPAFLLFGASVPVALAVNMLLSLAGVWLVAALGRALSGRNEVALLAALVFALWLPGVWNATMVAKENLSTPLLVALALCAVRLPHSRRPAILALAAGLLWGASVITGGSAVLLWAGVAVALWVLWRASGRLAAPARAGAAFAAGAVLALSPWLYATERMVGSPVLATNAAFNLYLGNNPAATGRFVSIADTPLGKDWNPTRVRLGEVANADRLQREAIAWATAHPADAAGLAVRKLVYFWQPSTPDAADFAASRAVAFVRLFEVAQYLLIVALGVAALVTPGLGRGEKWILGAMILGFWVVHAAAYIIPRYRDPVVPLLIVLAAVQVVAWARRASAPELAHVG